MNDNKNRESFWATLPGIIAAAVILVVVIAGLIALPVIIEAFLSNSPIPEKTPEGAARAIPRPRPTGIPAATPTPTPTPIPTPGPSVIEEEARRLLANAALNFDDIPSGYELAGAPAYVSNAEAAEDWLVENDLMLSKFEEWGRILGFGLAYNFAFYSRNLINTIELYEDDSGARASFEWVPPGYASWEESFADRLVTTIIQADLVGVQPLDFPAFGDASRAFNVRVDSRRLVSPFEVFVVCEVRGRLSACVIVMGPEVQAPAMLEELELLATAMDKKLRAAQNE